jgi:hypothetical protein
MFACVLRGALSPDDGSVRPVGPVSDDELQGSTTDVVEVELLQKGAPEGPPSPYP